LDVGPGVGEVDFAGFGADVGEGVEDVSEVRDWEIGRVVVASVDCLMVLVVGLVMREGRERRTYPVDEVGHGPVRAWIEASVDDVVVGSVGAIEGGIE
jgi:hypothetical protein